jgi:hypothetical protein
VELSNISLQSTLEFALKVNVDEARLDVATLRKRHPNRSNRELARAQFSNSGWKAVASGVLTGLPSNPWTAVPAALIDVGATLRIEVAAAARVAEIYDPAFLDDKDALWALLIPITGIELGSQALRELAVQGGMQSTKLLIRKFLSKETLESFKHLMLKYFGIKVAQKDIISKTLPIVGGLIGGTWNYFEVKAIGRRTIAFFESMEKASPSQNQPEMVDIVDVTGRPVAGGQA